MKALVINCSKKFYNLGAHKLADWLRATGHEVTLDNCDPGLEVIRYDAVYLSVIFSWHAPTARDIALLAKPYADVYCGGPGMTRLARWWAKETGLDCKTGLDWRFEQQRGNYRMTFASRGCPGMGTVENPKPCSFCIVPKIEGISFTLDYDFVPAPILCDNNLSALPADFQWWIRSRYLETGTRLLDANSGFEPHTFDKDTYQRWKGFLRGPWRFGFDTQKESVDVERMLGILKDESARRKQVYVLVGNESIGSCYDRTMRVLSLDRNRVARAEPFCQAEIALDALEKKPRVRFDWTEQRLADFVRYFNRHLWRYIPLTEYKPRNNEPPPFANFNFSSFDC